MQKKKRVIVSLVTAALLFAGVAPARSHDHDSTDDLNIPRRVANIAYPIGWAVDAALFRPLHTFISAPGLSYLTGHKKFTDEYEMNRNSTKDKGE